MVAVYLHPFTLFYSFAVHSVRLGFGFLLVEEIDIGMNALVLGASQSERGRVFAYDLTAPHYRLLFLFV